MSPPVRHADALCCHLATLHFQEVSEETWYAIVANLNGNWIYTRQTPPYPPEGHFVPLHSPHLPCCCCWSRFWWGWLQRYAARLFTSGRSCLYFIHQLWSGVEIWLASTPIPPPRPKSPCVFYVPWLWWLLFTVEIRNKLFSCCCSVSKSFTLAVLLLLLFTRRDWGSLRCAFYIPTPPYTHIHSLCAGGYRSNLAPPESQLFHPTRLPPLARHSISLWCILRFMFSYLCALFALHYQRPLWLSALEASEGLPATSSPWAPEESATARSNCRWNAKRRMAFVDCE